MSRRSGHRWSVSSELQQCYRQTNLCFSRRYSVERNQILEEETPGETAAEVLEDVKLLGS